ncbi:polyprenol phosphomannose-dependent alpha 1,6 mannosyltransferase MptB [Nesterenkonia sp.]|uniref:polyprenol phosphomannose-dependent alpha 1,6 mannosyltransferase MptB n=1 Tax=Nesterenkonia sp. TaxID=704201 RepID=UPI0026359526|nr:polyprenol phosphomannose-dependent alpha 1,6 mannosyltransferase MptB [Nesterenkonia sp.]
MITQRARARGPLVEGLIGSLMVLIGSLGVGWLVSISPIARWEWAIRLRTEADGVIFSTVVLTAGCWLMFRAWLRLGRALRGPDNDGDWPPGSLRTVNIATALWAAPQLLVLPIFSRDVFAYLNQGRLVLAGEDPYTTGVSTLDNWFHLGTDITWAHDETPYGPLFLWLEAAVMAVSGENPDMAIILFRLACAAGVVMIMYWVPKLAALHGVDAARAQWITVANPLLIISFVSSAHNDALMVGFALAGIWAAAHGRGVLATLLVVVSIGIKPITMVLLPFIGLLWAGPGSSWARKFRIWFATAGIAGAVLLVVGLVQGYGFGWLTVLVGTGSGATFWSPIAIAHGWFTAVLSAFGIPTYWTLDTLRLIGRVLSVLVVLYLMFRGSEEHIVQRMTWAFTAIVVLSPVIQPWYLLWLLPLFAVTGIRRGWEFKWVVFTVAFFLAFGAADQLSIYQFLELDHQMAALSLAVSWICIALMATVDPGTRWVVWQGWNLPRLRLRMPWRADAAPEEPPQSTSELHAVRPAPESAEEADRRG